MNPTDQEEKDDSMVLISVLRDDVDEAWGVVAAHGHESAKSIYTSGIRLSRRLLRTVSSERPGRGAEASGVDWYV